MLKIVDNFWNLEIIFLRLKKTKIVCQKTTKNKIIHTQILDSAKYLKSSAAFGRAALKFKIILSSLPPF